MKKFFIKLIASAVGGLLLGIIMTAKGAPAIVLLLGPLYVVGITFGASVVFPWVAKTLGIMGKASFLAFLASKPLLGLLALILLPFVLAVVMTIGWCIGFVKIIIEASGMISDVIHRNRKPTYIGSSRDGQGWLTDRQKDGGNSGAGYNPTGSSDLGDESWLTDISYPGDGSLSGDDPFPADDSFPDRDSFPEGDWLE